MKKKVLGILAVSAALMITACNAPANKSNAGGDPSSNEPAPSSEQRDARVAVASVKLDRNNVSLKPGAYTRLLATIAPENATNKNVLWSSSNPSVATVDQKGTVTAANKGTATITVKTFDGSFTDTCTVTVENKHAIQAKADNNVRILVADKAEEDSTVDVKLSFDKTKYYIEGVYANGVKCGTKGADFYFVMPATPVTLETRYHEIPAEKAFKDVFTNSEGVVLRNITNGRAEVGSKVTFAFSLIPGLDFNGELFAKANGADVPLTKEASNAYSFTMPNNDVEITVGTKAQLIPFDYYGDLAQDVISSVKVTFDGEEHTGWYKSYIPFGAQVEIKTFQPKAGLYDTYTIQELALCGQADVFLTEQYKSQGYDPTDFTAEIIEAEDDGYTFNFEMPANETWVYAVPTTRYIDFEVNSPSVIDVYQLEEFYGMYFSFPFVSAYYGQTVLLDLDCADGYAPRSVYLEPYEYYRNYYGSTQKQTTSRKEITVNADGYYEFVLDQRPVGNPVITVAAKDETELEGAPFQGDFLGDYTWGTNKDATVTSFTASNTQLNVAVDGDMNVGGSKYAFAGYDEFYGVGAMYDPTAVNPNYHYFMYKNGVFYTTKGTSLFSDVYKYIYFQKDANDAGDEEYKLVYENIEGGKVFVGKFFRNGALYQTAYINYNTEEFYTGVDIYMYEGNEITDTNASYDVVYGHKRVAMIGYKGTGGAGNRGIIPENALYGVYANDIGQYGDIVADGFGNYTFDGQPATFISYDDVTSELVFKAADEYTYYVSVSRLLGTYSVIKVEEPKNALLVGKVYEGTGKCYGNSSCSYEKGNATYRIEFLDVKHVKVTLTYDGVSYTATKAALLEKCVFSFDGTNLEVKFCPEDGNKYSSNANVATWNFTVASDFSTLTLANGSSVPCIETDSSYLYFSPKAGLNLL